MVYGGYGESLLKRDFKQTITQLRLKKGHGELDFKQSVTLRKPTHLVVVGSIDVPRHSKVGDLYDHARTHEAVSCGHISVDKPQSLEMFHTRGTLKRD